MQTVEKKYDLYLDLRSFDLTVHAEVLPWTIGPPSFVSILYTVFLSGFPFRARTDRQTYRQTDRQTNATERSVHHRRLYSRGGITIIVTTAV